jgi:hypothetical protein
MGRSLDVEKIFFNRFGQWRGALVFQGYVAGFK